MTDSYSSRKTFRARLDRMIRELKGEITTGLRQSGEFLPSERELTRKYQLSNKLVRVALQTLAEDGYITKIPRVGSRVNLISKQEVHPVRFGYHLSLEMEAALPILLERFHLKYPDILVHPVPLPFAQYETAVQHYLESGQLDVITLNINNFEYFKSRSLLQSFEPGELHTRLYPNAAFTWNDQLWAQPFLFSPLVLCWNRDHLAKLGINSFEPSDWDELMDAAARLTVDNESIGFYFFLFSLNRWPLFLLQSGVCLTNYATAHVYEAADLIMEGLSACRNLLYADRGFPVFLSESETVVEDLFLQEKVSIIMTSYFALNKFKQSSINYDLAPLPSFNLHRSIQMAIGLAVSKRSEQSVASRRLVDFLTSQEAGEMISTHTLSLHARSLDPDFREGDSLGTLPPHFDLYKQMLEQSLFITDTGLNLETLGTIKEEARLYWAKLQSYSTTRERIVRRLLEQKDGLQDP